MMKIIPTTMTTANVEIAKVNRWKSLDMRQRCSYEYKLIIGCSVVIAISIIFKTLIS